MVLSLGFSLTGCQPNGLTHFAPSTPANQIQNTLKGQVQWPASLAGKSRSFQITATLTDLLDSSTVSLIDATTNVTVASGLTTANGQFVLSPDTAVLLNENGAYLLESNKRLNLIGTQALFLRTLVIRKNQNFLSLTRSADQPNSKILLNTMTTAVSIAEHLDNTIAPPDVMGTVQGATLLRDLSATATIAAIQLIRTQVETNLNNGNDPLQDTYTL